MTLLFQLLKKYVLVLTCTLPVRRGVPWYNAEIAVTKRKRRQLERYWRHAGLAIYRCLFQEQEMQQKVCLGEWVLVTSTRISWKRKVTRKRLFCVINSLSNKSAAPARSAHESAEALATLSWGCLVDKVTELRNQQRLWLPCLGAAL